jgi:hypothetical protein
MQGTTYAVSKGGFTVSWESNLEQARLSAETHARSGGAPILFRFFRKRDGGEQFVTAYWARNGKVQDWPEVTIPLEQW